MDYRLEHLSEDDFEQLVNTICQKILGIGVVSFSKGKDGGRDGRFEGTANEYPSKSAAWSGKFIIQSKHTSDYNASCSDKAFFGNKKESTINGEIQKIKVLQSKNEIDNYLLFTNRKETENRENAVKHIKKETGLVNVDIIGKETLHNYLSQNREIVKQFGLDKFTMPLILTDYDIKEVIIAFGKQVKTIRNINVITEEQLLCNIPKEEKNEKNNLSKNYYESQIKGKSLQFFAQIDDFLQQNEDLAKIYLNFASELSNKIEVKRHTFEKFEEIFVYLYDLIFEENKIELNKDRRFIWIFLHHLYYNCHIGRT